MNMNKSLFKLSLVALATVCCLGGAKADTIGYTQLSNGYWVRLSDNSGPYVYDGTVFTLANASSGGGVSAVVTNAGTFAVQNNAATPAGTNLIGKVGIDQTTNGTTNQVSAVQNGTWTVQVGNTPNTTPILVDGSGVTQPVSIATAPVLVAGSAV